MSLAGVLRYNIHAVHGSEELVHTGWLVPTASGDYPGDGDWGGATFLPSLSQQELDLLCSAIASEWATFMTAENNDFAPTLIYDRVDLYEMDATLHSVGQSTYTWPTANQPKGTGSSEAPYPLSVCATLRTGLPGRSRRGRLYLGGLSGAWINTSGRASGAKVTGLGNALKAFYNNVGAYAYDGATGRAHPSVVSRRKNDARQLKAVDIDDVFDWQSRRQDSLTPTWQHFLL